MIWVRVTANELFCDAEVKDQNLILVVLNPLCNQLFFYFSASLYLRWVSRHIWSSQVEMVTWFVHQDHFIVHHAVFKDTTSMPWVVLSVWKDDVGWRLKVLTRVSATKVVKSPIILWSHFVWRLTSRSKGRLIPVVPCEARLSWIIAHWHRELATCLNTPSAII